MRCATLALLALAGLSACSQPPRAISYFKAHPEETGRMLVQCTAGAHRGVECDNAQAARAQIESDARMAEYKKHF